MIPEIVMLAVGLVVGAVATWLIFRETLFSKRGTPWSR
jgi:hypothetical protein